MKIKSIIWSCFLICFLCSPITASVELQVSGSLPPINGTFISGSHAATIGIYKGTTGTPVWSEPIASVTFRNGMFTTIIGKVTPLEASYLYVTNPHIGITLTDTPHTIQFVKLTASPYAFKAAVAERARKVSANVITGTMVSTANLSKGLYVKASSQNYSLFVNANSVGIGKSNPTTKLDINGIINADGFRIRGEDIAGALSWKPNTVITQNIYFNTGRVGIGTSIPRYTLEVAGTINASELFTKSRKISSTLDWQRSPVASENLYFINLDKKVGIGVENPRSKLHVLNEIRVSTNVYPAAVGMIRRSSANNEIEGYTTRGWLPLTGVRGGGQKDRLTFFTTPKNISSSPLFLQNHTNSFVGVGVSAPNSTLQIKETNSNKKLFQVTSTQNKTLLMVGSTGNVGIGTPTPNQKLKVIGSLAADDITLNGLSILLAVSKDSVWLLNASHNVYYMLGNVGIGQNRPESLLEIAQRTNSNDDPAITLTNGRNVSYTMGVDNDKPDTFRVEFGTTLGSTSPLFVAKNNFLGIGLETPLAPLHINGKIGTVFSGTFYGVPEETAQELDPLTGDELIPTLPKEGPGTRFLWQPQRAIFRAGQVESTSPYLRGENWDNENSGKFSNAFGLNSIGSGNYTTVAGGKNNIGSGAYSTVAGGENNISEGDFSLAVGKNATALHEGSFIFLDSSAAPTSTIKHSQFLVFASRGMGIGTTLTTVDGIRSGLTIKRDKSSGNILRFIGYPTENTGTALSSSGNMIIGSLTPGNAKLSIMGAMNIGGTPRTPSGNIITANIKLSVNRDTPGLYNTFIKSIEAITTPGMAILSGPGHIGMAIIPNMFTAADLLTGLQVGSGSVLASEYIQPDGTRLGKEAVIVWLENSDGDVYFVSGNTGIGMASPNSMLELSNIGNTLFANPQNPAISFTSSPISYSIGVKRSGNSALRIINGINLTTDTPAFAIHDNKIGIKTDTPLAMLHVNGNAIFRSGLAVGTTNQQANQLTVPSVMTRGLNIRGDVVTSSGDKWSITGNTVYKSLLDPVGIGTSTPRTDLEVIGIVSANSFVVKNQFDVLGNTKVNRIDFNLDESEFRFEVQNEKLFLDDVPLSDILSRGLPSDTSIGPIVIWVVDPTRDTDQILSETDMIWYSETPRRIGTLVSSHNINIGNTIKDSSTSFEKTIQVKVGTQSILDGLSLQGNITHDGTLSHSKNFTLRSSRLVIDERWSTPSTTNVQYANHIFDIYGKSVKLKNSNDGAGTTSMINQAPATGVRVNVSDVKPQTSAEKVYSAIFMGDVGIKKFPAAITGEYILDVKGIVSANRFIISKRLRITTINANNILFINEATNAIGIGTSTPTTTLEVKNEIKTTHLRARSLDTNKLVVQTKSLYVDNQKVGMGTITPESLLHISKTLTRTPTTEYINFLITTNIQTTQKNNKGLEIVLATSANSTFGTLTTPKTVKGMDITMANFNSHDSGQVIGISAETKRQNNAYSAIFKGGNVGIGVPNPVYPLQVSGTIRADNVLQINLLTRQEAASFNYLNVLSPTDNTMISGTAIARNMVVRKMKQSSRSFIVNNQINLPTITLQVTANGFLEAINLIASESIKTKDMTSSRLLSGKDAEFQGLTIGIAEETLDTVRVQTSANATQIIADKSILAGAAKINSTTLSVLPYGFVGINEATPRAILDVKLTNDTFVTLHNNSNTENTSVGIIFTPASATNIRNIGSGIVAIKTTADISASELAFMTNPVSNTPQERMRMFNEGGIRIGAPTVSEIVPKKSHLLVKGTALVSGISTVNLYVNTETIRNNGNIRIANSIKIFDQDFIVSRNLMTNTVQLQELSSHPVTSNQKSILYAFNNGSAAGIYYGTILEDGVFATGNMEDTFTGTRKVIPAFNSSHSIVDTNVMHWTTSNINSVGIGKLTVGSHITSNVVGSEASQLHVAGVTNSVLADKTLKKLQLEFKDRNTAGFRTFQGYKLTSTFATSKLAENEQMIGLDVNLTTLASESRRFGNGTILRGTKYAALFRGAPVGIGNATPSSQLHVVETTSINAFIVDGHQAGVTTNALTLKSNGYLGFGTNAPEAKVSIKTPATDTTFKIQGVTENILMLITNGGKIGINQSNPTYNLDILGTLKAKKATSNILLGKTMNIRNQALVVDQNGYVGINNASPAAQLDLIKTFTTSDSNALYNLQKINLTTSGAISKGITGVEYKIAVNTNTIVGIPAQSKTVTGAKFNLSNLAAQSISAKIIGLQVLVTRNTSPVAIFNGGKVGIGVTEPTYMLHVNGGIKARHVTLNSSSRTQATAITTNTLSAINAGLGNMTINNNKHIIIRGTLQAANFIKEFPFLNRAPTANPVFLLAQVVTANRLRIGTSSISTTTPVIIQGTSIFTGGSLVIKDTPGILQNPSANLHIYGNSETSQKVALLVLKNNIPILRVDKVGNVGSFAATPGGNVNPTANLYLQSDFGRVVSIEDPVSKVFIVSQNTLVTLGNQRIGPMSVLSIKQKTADTPILRVESAQVPYTMFIPASQLIGLGTSLPLAALHVSGSMIIDKVGTPKLVQISPTGSIGLGTPATRFTLSTLENMQLSSSNMSGGSVPTEISTFTGNGTLMRIGTRHLFFGLQPHPTLVNTYDTHIQASSASDSQYIFRNGDTEIMRLVDTKLGVGTSRPSANIHVVGASGSLTPLFNVSRGTSKNILFINATGEIVINGTRASADIDVNGNVSSLGFQNHPDGTEFTAPTLNVTNAKFAARSIFDIIKTTSANKTHKLETIRINLERDHSKALTAFDFGITGGSTFRNIGTNANAYGLRIDVNGIKLPDPTFQNQTAFKYAAIFRGGNVGIGTLTPDEATLNVVITTTNGTVLQSGIVVSMRTTPNIIPGGIADRGSQLQFVINPSYNIPLTQRFAVPTDSFKSIVYTLGQGQFYLGGSTFYATTAISNQVMKSLKDNGVLTSDGRVDGVITSYANLLTQLRNKYLSGFVQDYITTSDVAKVLTPFIIENSFTFKTKNLDSDANKINSPLTLYSGTYPIIPITTGSEDSIQKQAFQFVGRVLINAGPISGSALDNEGPDSYGNRMPVLIVSGDMRVGAKVNKTETEFAGQGKKLIFSGGYLINSSTTDGNNEDPMHITRVNTNDQASDLQISIGEDHTINNAAFKIGVSEITNQKWHTSLVARTFSETSNANTSMVGIGLNNPTTAFYVKGVAAFNMRPDVTSNTTTFVTNNIAHRALVLFENTTANANSLLIKHSAEASNGVVGSDSNFISFKSSISPTGALISLGAIEGNGETGVQLTSPEADYAEYLPKLYNSEEISSGQIVGVFNGKVSKVTKGADQIMVTSVAPIIAGNWQGDTKTKQVLVAFLGQVPIKIRGAVSAGDYVIPSGLNDGTGIAIKPNEINAKNSDLILGRAWGINSVDKVSTVTVLLGLTKSPAHTISSQKVETLAEKLITLESNIAQLETTYQNVLQKQRDQIKLLKAKVKK